MRTAFALLVSLLCAQGLLVSAQNSSKTMVDVLGQSGKFYVYKESEGRSNGIQVTMDELKELDSAGSAVGTSGSVKHSINTFAAQDFTILPMEEVTLVAGQLEAGSTSENGVLADKISFFSPVSSIGQVKIDTYVIKEDGLLGPPNETWSVQTGDLKWSIELSSWDWCGCQQGQTVQTGDMIDVVVSVKGLFDAAQTNGKTVSLGGGVNLELSDQVNVDGAWEQMPTGYPMVEIQGSQVKLTFRFPKFTQRAVYDPAITGISGDEETGSDEETTTTVEEEEATTTTVEEEETTTTVEEEETTTTVDGGSDTTTPADSTTGDGTVSTGATGLAAAPATLLAACLAALLA